MGIKHTFILLSFMLLGTASYCFAGAPQAIPTEVEKDLGLTESHFYHPALHDVLVLEYGTLILRTVEHLRKLKQEQSGDEGDSFLEARRKLEDTQLRDLLRTTKNRLVIFEQDLPNDPKNARATIDKLALRFKGNLAAINSANSCRHLDPSNPYRGKLCQRIIKEEIAIARVVLEKALLQVFKVSYFLQEKKPSKLPRNIGWVGGVLSFFTIGIGGQLDPSWAMPWGFGIGGATAILAYTTARIQKLFNTWNLPRVPQKLWNRFVTQSGLIDLKLVSKRQKPLDVGSSLFCNLSLMSSDALGSDNVIPLLAAPGDPDDGIISD